MVESSRAYSVIPFGAPGTGKSNLCNILIGKPGTFISSKTSGGGETKKSRVSRLQPLGRKETNCFKFGTLPVSETSSFLFWKSCMKLRHASQKNQFSMLHWLWLRLRTTVRQLQKSLLWDLSKISLTTLTSIRCFVYSHTAIRALLNQRSSRRRFSPWRSGAASK